MIHCHSFYWYMSRYRSYWFLNRLELSILQNNRLNECISLKKYWQVLWRHYWFRIFNDFMMSWYYDIKKLYCDRVLIHYPDGGSGEFLDHLVSMHPCVIVMQYIPGHSDTPGHTSKPEIQTGTSVHRNNLWNSQTGHPIKLQKGMTEWAGNCWNNEQRYVPTHDSIESKGQNNQD